MKTTISKLEKQDLKDMMALARHYAKEADNLYDEMSDMLEGKGDDDIDWLLDAIYNEGSVSKELNIALKNMGIRVE